MAEAAALTLSRLIALTEYVAANSGVTVVEAARHFGRSPRQIRKDVGLLLDAGFGDLLPGNTLELDANAYFDEGILALRTPLGLDQTTIITDQELALMIYGLHAIAQTLTPEESSAIPTATEKLFALAGVTSHQSCPNEPWFSVTTVLSAAGKLDLIRAAIDESKALQIDYVRGDGQRSVRTVFPLSLTFERDGWVLSAICDKSGDSRLFRLDRMVSVEVTETRTSSKPRTYPVETTTQGADEVVTVCLSPDAAWVTHEIAASRIRISEDSIQADFTVWDPNWIRTEVLLLAEDVLCTDPESTKVESGKFARSALSAWNQVRAGWNVLTDEPEE